MMQKMKLAAVCLLLMLTLIPFDQGSAADELSLVWETSPTAEHILPDSDLVTSTLLIRDTNGDPVEDAHVRLALDSPSRNLVISTDFPWVESTRLLIFDGTVTGGKFTFDYIYPIRGSYTLVADITPQGGQTSHETLHLVIPENPAEVRNLALFLALLAAFGLVSGWVVGRGSQARLSASGAAVLLIALIAPASAYADGEHPGDSAQARLEHTEESGDYALTFGLEPGAGRVGQLNHVDLNLTRQGEAADDVIFEVVFWHLPDARPVLATTLNAPSGTTELDVQFFDGTVHEIRVSAQTADGETIALQHEIEVEALHPPMTTKLRTLGLLLLFTASFMLVGFWLAHRQKIAARGSAA
jgi:hypothetical protein